MKRIPRILKINNIEGYKVSCLFSNGESRLIDFDMLFQKWQVQPGEVEYELQQDIEKFQQIEITNHTLGWSSIQIALEHEQGHPIMVPFELDPLVLYENSVPDEANEPKIGLLIKTARQKAGLTQEELAVRSGTTKHYISRIENEKSDIELLTLRKIVEAGLGKQLEIKIS
jgi:DNA-binding XRE family transcriptional regulator